MKIDCWLKQVAGGPSPPSVSTHECLRLKLVSGRCLRTVHNRIQVKLEQYERKIPRQVATTGAMSKRDNTHFSKWRRRITREHMMGIVRSHDP